MSGQNIPQQTRAPGPSAIRDRLESGHPAGFRYISEVSAERHPQTGRFSMHINSGVPAGLSGPVGIRCTWLRPAAGQAMHPKLEDQ